MLPYRKVWKRLAEIVEDNVTGFTSSVKQMRQLRNGNSLAWRGAGVRAGFERRFRRMAQDY
jgi:hypothetical protein